MNEEFKMGLAIVDDHKSPKTLRIALIDADPVDRVVTQHILTRRGHQVTAFEHSDSVGDRLGDDPVDVIVISGDDAGLESVTSALTLRGHVPIVAITNQKIDPDSLAELAIVLPRPVGSRELLAAVAMAGRKGHTVIVHR